MRWQLLMSSTLPQCEYASCQWPSRRICPESGLGSTLTERTPWNRSNSVYAHQSLLCTMHTSFLTNLYSHSMTLSCLTIPQSTSSATEISFGTWNTRISHHLNDCCNSLRRRTHILKRRAETEDAPRKRSRPLPGANGATGSRAVVGGVGINGFAFPAPVRPGGNRSTGSSSSDTSSESSSDDTSSNSDSTSESTSGSSSDSDSDSTSSATSHDLRRPPPSSKPQRKSSQPRYVTFTLPRIYLSTAFVPQACFGTAWIWEGADPQTQRAPPETTRGGA